MLSLELDKLALVWHQEAEFVVGGFKPGRYPKDRPSPPDSVSEPQVNADVALAFLEMGMLLDALYQAALSLDAIKKSNKAHEDAMEVIFGPRLLKTAGLEKLRAFLLPS